MGPLRIEHGGRGITPNAAKQRQVLAMLLVNANKPVRMTELIHELWGENPPVSAVNTLQTYILRIRRILTDHDPDPDQGHEQGQGSGSDSGKAVLLTRPAAYQFKVDRENLDLYVFDEHVSSGTEAFQRGDYPRASAQLRAALQLCHGPILTDVRIGPRLAVHCARLEEAVLRVLELRIEADLQRGCHRELVSELTGLVAEHRTHERLHGQLMIALYQAGRRVEALEVYQRLRNTFVQDLGIEPTDWLSRIQQAILSADLDTTELLSQRRPGGRPLTVLSAMG
ncbi:AfsR/SARP family transcriptional regulator [Actinomadura chokoriensis]|uniref:AfsR/SARP family transcriptional regulator n=1 Tax=Actinomadura chokoriensis TaxID=454156 RepID=A0ABV4R4K2_9ACTN